MNQKQFLRLFFYLLVLVSLRGAVAHAEELTPDGIDGNWLGSDGKTYKISVPRAPVVSEISVDQVTDKTKSRLFYGTFNADRIKLIYTPRTIDDFGPTLPEKVRQQMLDRHVEYHAALSKPEGEALTFILWRPAVSFDPKTLKVKDVFVQNGEADDVITLTRNKSRIATLEVKDLVREEKIAELRKKIETLEKEAIPKAQELSVQKVAQFREAVKRADEAHAQKLAAEEKLSAELDAWRNYWRECSTPGTRMGVCSKTSAETAEAKIRELETVYSEEQKKLSAAGDSLQAPFEAMEKSETDVLNLAHELADLQNKLFEALTVSSITEVVVDHHGKTVYQAKWDVTPEELKHRELRQQLKELKEERDQLEQSKKEAFNLFKQASDITSYLQKKLSGDQKARGKGDWAKLKGLADGGLILNTAWKNAGIETVFYAYDMLRAGKDGGIYGMLGEAGSKLAEALISNALSEGKAYGEAVDPVSVEAAVNEAYGINTKDSYSLISLKVAGSKFVIERTLKSTFLSATKGAINEWAFKNRTTYLVKLARSRKASAAAVKTLIAQARKIREGGKLWPKPAKLAEGIIKDLLKAELKAAVNQVEHDAWVELFSQEIEARALFQIYAVANNSFIEIDTEHQTLLEEYGKVNTEADKPNYNEIVNEPFDNGSELGVEIKVTDAAKSSKEHVMSDRDECKFAGPHQFRCVISGEDARQVNLKIEQFDHPLLNWDRSSFGESSTKPAEAIGGTPKE